jgi:hypothetical protein
MARKTAKKAVKTSDLEAGGSGTRSASEATRKLFREAVEGMDPRFLERIRPYVETLSPRPGGSDEGSGRAIPFSEFVEFTALLGRLIDDRGKTDVNGLSVSDLGTCIHNHGDDRDNAEGMFALYPIAARILERMESKGK